MSVDEKYLQSLIVDEAAVIAASDVGHLENYRKLSSYLEAAIQESVGKEDSYFTLYKSCAGAIKLLTELIRSYESQVLLAKGQNALIAHIISNNFADEIQDEDDSNELKKTEG